MGATSLNHILSIGSESLANSRIGVDVTGHNIANAQVPGYSRQRLDQQTRDAISDGTKVIGNGARIANIVRAHDEFVEGQIIKEQQVTGQKRVLVDGLQKLEKILSPELNSSVRNRMVAFNNAIRNLSNYPEENSTRTHLQETGRSFVQALNNTYEQVDQVQRDMTDEIESVSRILNQKLAEVADLNQRIREMEAGSAKANDLQDRRDMCLRNIAEIIDVKVYTDSNNQWVLRGPQGALLVEGSHAAQFFQKTNDLGKFPVLMMRDVLGQSQRDVTQSVSMGKLAALLNLRDQHAASMKNDLNSVAKLYGDAFNEIHRKGYGQGQYAETNGRDFFANLDSADGEFAKHIELSALIHNDIQAVSVSISPKATGDNVLANLLQKLSDTPLGQGGLTVNGIYDSMAARLGINSLQAKEDKAASETVLSQLEGQRESIAGVSLDEEASNLLKYQHLFTASSRLINTVDQMMQTILELKR